MRAATLATAFVLVLASGCAAPEEQTVDGELPSLEIAADESVIVVQVIDDALNPVPDALVTLDGTTQSASGEDGRATFRPVTPGEHAVTATKAGFVDSAKSVSVDAGAAAEVILTLVDAASLEAYFETSIRSGIVGCSAALRPGTPNSQPLAVCGTVTGFSANPLDTSTLDWPINPQDPTLAGYWAETVWTSNQAFGAGMSISWFTADVGFTGSAFAAPEDQDVHVVKIQEGVSPVGMRLLIEEVRNTTGDILGISLCETEECFLISGHYTAAETARTAVDVGVSFQQRYEDFLTAFHSTPVPETFTVLPDA